MGHIVLNLNIDLESITRDLYVDFNVLAFFEHDIIHNTYRIQTISGSEDEKPMAGSSNMFLRLVWRGTQQACMLKLQTVLCKSLKVKELMLQ